MSQIEKHHDTKEWVVKSREGVSLLQVLRPEGAEGHGDEVTRDYWQVELERWGKPLTGWRKPLLGWLRVLVGWLRPLPVLRPVIQLGNGDDFLTVSTSHKWINEDADPPKSFALTVADAKAYRWYRFTQSFPQLAAGAVLSPIGSLLVALGALDYKSGWGIGLLVAGGGLVVVAVVVFVTSMWQAPI